MDAARTFAPTGPQGPLHRLEVEFQHHAYDWNDTAPLGRQLADLAARHVGGSSSRGPRGQPVSINIFHQKRTTILRASKPIKRRVHQPTAQCLYISARLQ
jgi:hypothetical protein